MGLITKRLRLHSKYARTSRPGELVSDDLIGVEFEVEDVSYVDEDNSRDTIEREWAVGRDGSLRNGTEFTFLEPYYGERAVKAIDSFFEHTDFDVSHRTGLHVHLNMTDADDSDDIARNLLLTYLLLEPAIYAWAGDSRRGCGFCLSLEDAEGNIPLLVDMFHPKRTISDEKWRNCATQLGRYQGLNFASLHKFGTVEFRHMPMPTERGPVIEWINVILSIKRIAKLLVAQGETVLGLYKRLGHRGFVDAVFDDSAPTFTGTYCTEDNFYKAMRHVALLQFEFEKDAPDDEAEDGPISSASALEEYTTSLQARTNLMNTMLTHYFATGELPPEEPPVEPPVAWASWWHNLHNTQPTTTTTEGSN